MAQSVTLDIESPNLLSDLGRAAAELRERLSTGPKQIRSSRSHNSFFIAREFFSSSNELNSNLDNLFARLAPGRLFEFVESKTESLELEALLEEISAGEEMLSWRLGWEGASSSLERFFSLIRAWSFVGSDWSFVLGGDPLSRVALSAINLDASSQVFIDSRNGFWEEADLRLLVDSSAEVVDVAWLVTAPWRRRIKQALSHPACALSAAGIAYISVDFGRNSAMLSPWCAELLGGWLTSSLGWEVKAVSMKEIEMLDSAGRSCGLAFKKHSDPEHLEIGLRGHDGDEVHLKRIGSEVEVSLSSQSELRLRESMVANTGQDVLSRFFLVGESTSNYQSSLEVALQLHALKSGLAM